MKTFLELIILREHYPLAFPTAPLYFLSRSTPTIPVLIFLVTIKRIFIKQMLLDISLIMPFAWKNPKTYGPSNRLDKTNHVSPLWFFLRGIFHRAIVNFLNQAQFHL